MRTPHAEIHSQVHRRAVGMRLYQHSVYVGFWLENLTDMFTTLSFPAAENFGKTFAVVFSTRVVENMAYLVFQLDTWFKFRIWIKGKFKKDQVRTEYVPNEAPFDVLMSTIFSATMKDPNLPKVFSVRCCPRPTLGVLRSLYTLEYFLLPTILVFWCKPLGVT